VATAKETIQRKGTVEMLIDAHKNYLMFAHAAARRGLCKFTAE